MKYLKMYFLGVYLYWVRREGEQLAEFNWMISILAVVTFNLVTISLITLKFWDFTIYPSFDPNKTDRLELYMYGLGGLVVLGWLISKIGGKRILKDEANKLTGSEKMKYINNAIRFSVSSAVLVFATALILFVVLD